MRLDSIEETAFDVIALLSELHQTVQAPTQPHDETSACSDANVFGYVIGHRHTADAGFSFSIDPQADTNRIGALRRA